MRPVAADDRIEQRAAFDAVRYASCWEDADVLCAALRVRPGMRVLSICSAGDNVLALAGEGAEVVAVDLSAAQLACLELRIAAFRRLDHAGVLALLGVRQCDDRPALYARVEPLMSEPARTFWRRQPGAIAAGAIHAGRFERYFATFRRRVLPLIHRRATVCALLEPRGERARRDFYEQRWSNLRWRVLFRLFFGRRAMGHLGRDPEFFRYVSGSVGEMILARAEHGLIALPTHDNPFLRYILTGNFDECALPRYLRADRFDAIRTGLERRPPVLVHGPIEHAAGRYHGPGFDGFNASDIFEYVSPEAAERLYGALLDAARPGARIAYWNTLVPRRRPERFAPTVAALDGVAATLHARDRAFFYTAFHVDEVRTDMAWRPSHATEPTDSHRDPALPVLGAAGGPG